MNTLSTLVLDVNRITKKLRDVELMYTYFFNACLFITLRGLRIHIVGLDISISLGYLFPIMFKMLLFWKAQTLFWNLYQGIIMRPCLLAWA